MLPSSNIMNESFMQSTSGFFSFCCFCFVLFVCLLLLLFFFGGGDVFFVFWGVGGRGAFL